MASLVAAYHLGLLRAAAALHGGEGRRLPNRLKIKVEKRYSENKFLQRILKNAKKKNNNNNNTVKSF